MRQNTRLLWLLKRVVNLKKQIALDFKIPMSTLSTWIKKSDEIKQKYLSGEMGSQRKKNRGAKFPEVEQALLKWFKNARDQNVTISGEIMREKAKFFAAKLEIPDDEFECSVGWLERFKSRHGITFKRVCGESNSVAQNSEEMENWKNKLANILDEFSADQIYNADETGIFYRLLPDKTLEFKNVDCHGGKLSKDRLTALVCSNMSGTDKLPLLVIGKSKNPRCFKHVKSLPTEYLANKKAWMTSEIFIDWLHKVDKKMTKRKKKIVMIVDNCPAHPNVPGLKSVNLVFLPPNSTSITQPMDQGVIKNLKVHYRKLIIQKKIRAIDSKTDLVITVLDALHMLNQAWSNVTSTTISNCFRHAGFQTPVDDGDQSDEDPDDNIPLARICSLGFGPTVSVDDYISVDDSLPTSATITDDNIVSSRNLDADYNSDNDDEEPTSGPIRRPMSEVLTAMDIIRDHLELNKNSKTATT